MDSADQLIYYAAVQGAATLHSAEYIMVSV